MTRIPTSTALPGARLHLGHKALAFLRLTSEGITEDRVGALDAARSSLGVPLVAIAVPYLSIALAGGPQHTRGIGAVISSFASTAVPDTRGGISPGLGKGELSLRVPPKLHLLPDLHQVQPRRAHQAFTFAAMVSKWLTRLVAPLAPNLKTPRMYSMGVCTSVGRQNS